MSRAIDCVLIGHNQIEFARHEEQVRRTGVRSPAYRDLGLNFIRVGDKPMTLGELWNAAVERAERPHRPLRLFDNFSATLAYLGSFLDAHGASFDYVESFQDDKARLRSLLTENDVLTVGVTTTYYTQAEPVVEIVSFIREVNPRVRVVVGGPYVTTQTRGCSDAELHPLFDYIGADVYVNSSQGEASLVALISALKQERSLSTVENLIFKANGRWVQTP